MSWTLLRAGVADPDPQAYTLRDDTTTYIVSLHSDDSAGIVHELPDPDVYTELGRITVFDGVAKLEAVDRELPILAAGKQSELEAFALQPRKDGRVEILLLRDGDIISPRKAGFNLTCKKEPASEVQVNSSAADTGAQEAVNSRDGVTDAAEEETEDEDLDKTCTTIKATQNKSQQIQPTPQQSEPRSVVVHETPTIGRFGTAPEDPNSNAMNDGRPQSIENTPTPEILEQTGIQPFSTARTRQSQQVAKPADDTVKSPNVHHGHEIDETPVPDKITPPTRGAPSEYQRGKRGPKVVVARKRSSPAPNEVEVDEEEAERSTKRAKRNPTTDDNTQTSNSSNIAVDTSPAVAPAKKGRKRKSAANDVEDLDEGTPQSNKSSQRSTSAATADIYSGEIPCVATSNSAITDKTQAAKFLKKQGGSLVDSVKDVFNVLCVRDGDLVKTSKVLQAIAAGVPIVTDKWLFDSAKAGGLLAIDAYKPDIPNQEKEWDIKLEDIIGQPQTPFRDVTLHFTTNAHALYNPFKDIEHVCKTAGAEKITIKKKIGKNGNIIVIAADKNDKEAEKHAQDGMPCYYRGIVPMSIIRGTLDLESAEFKFGNDDAGTGSTAKENETKTKRGRKS